MWRRLSSVSGCQSKLGLGLRVWLGTGPHCPLYGLANDAQVIGWFLSSHVQGSTPFYSVPTESWAFCQARPLDILSLTSPATFEVDVVIILFFWRWGDSSSEIPRNLRWRILSPNQARSVMFQFLRNGALNWTRDLKAGICDTGAIPWLSGMTSKKDQPSRGANLWNLKVYLCPEDQTFYFFFHFEVSVALRPDLDHVESRINRTKRSGI